MYEKLPQELKERGAFCLWRYEQRNGDTTKVPYQPSGLRGDSTSRAAFTDFASAVGHTVNFKTYRKSCKQKKQLKNDPSEWQIFKNTHEAIIDKETYDIVQRIRDGSEKVYGCAGIDC